MDRSEMTVGQGAEGPELQGLSEVLHVDEVPEPPTGEVRLDVGQGHSLAFGWFSVGPKSLRGEDGFIVLVPESCGAFVVIAMWAEESDTGESIPLPLGARSGMAAVARGVREAAVLEKEDIFRAAHKRIAERGQVLRGGAGDIDQRETAVADMTPLMKTCAWIAVQHVVEHGGQPSPQSG